MALCVAPRAITRITAPASTQSRLKLLTLPPCSAVRVSLWLQGHQGRCGLVVVVCTLKQLPVVHRTPLVLAHSKLFPYPMHTYTHAYTA
jgi:hypothetical protein